MALCTYNGANFLHEQLESILRQTETPDELVVTDDGSQDDTVDIVRRFADSAPFPVRLHERTQPVGPTANFSDTLARCSGDLIFLCDQDDVWAEDKIRTFRRIFIAEQPLLAFSDADLIGPKGEPLGHRQWTRLGVQDRELLALSGPRGVSQLLHKSMVTGASAAVRRDLIGAACPIPTELGLLHDGWLALVAAYLGRVSWTREPLLRYRQHAGQWTGAPVDGAARTAQRTGVRLSTRYDFSQQTRQAEALLARGAQLRQQGFDGADHLREEFVRSHVEHVTARDSLGRGARDLPLILRELLARRYEEHSQGWRSAGKDLLMTACRRAEGQGAMR